MAEAKKMNGNGKLPEPFQVRRGGSAMRLRPAASNEWLCVVPADVKPADLTKPDVFSLLGKDLRPRDTIQVFAVDNSYFAELVVLGAGLGWVEVALLRSQDLPKTEARESDAIAGFDLVQDGINYTWHAVRKVDRAVLGRSEGLKSKKDLIRYIEDHATVRQR